MNCLRASSTGSPACAASGGGAAFPEPNHQRLAGADTQHIGVVDPAASGQSLPLRKRGVEATGIISLSPAWARAGAGPRSGRWSTRWRKAQVPGQGGRQDKPALAARRWPSKAMRIRSGWLRDRICRVLLFWSRLWVSKTLIPEAHEHPLAYSSHH